MGDAFRGRASTWSAGSTAQSYLLSPLAAGGAGSGGGGSGGSGSIAEGDVSPSLQEPYQYRLAPSTPASPYGAAARGLLTVPPSWRYPSSGIQFPPSNTGGNGSTDIFLPNANRNLRDADYGMGGGGGSLFGSFSRLDWPAGSLPTSAFSAGPAFGASGDVGYGAYMKNDYSSGASGGLGGAPSACRGGQNSNVVGASSVKRPARRNPWGPETYSDLIAKAIDSYPEKQATLQQIYDYISTNYAYFRDRSDPPASAGWKVCPVFLFSLFQIRK